LHLLPTPKKKADMNFVVDYGEEENAFDKSIETVVSGINRSPLLSPSTVSSQKKKKKIR